MSIRGALFNSVTQPDHSNVDIQWMHKAHYAYLGNSLTGYLLGDQMEKLANNPLQSQEPQGMLVFNPSSVTDHASDSNSIQLQSERKASERRPYASCAYEQRSQPCRCQLWDG